MTTEICQIIKASQVGDKAKAEAYARLLAENLDKDGKHKEATRVLRALDFPTLQTSTVCFDDESSLR